MTNRTDPPTPQVLGFSSFNDFRAYFFKHFVRAQILANRCGVQVRVIFAEENWYHVFWKHTTTFNLDRAERMPWILEALKRPEEIRDAYKGKRDVYVLTKEMWGEDFCVVVEKPNKTGKCHFITAYPPSLRSMLKIRVCNPLACP